MRLVACVTVCLTTILTNTGQTEAQNAPSEPQAYCVNQNAEFYLYTGEPCKNGYQLGAGNCRTADRRFCQQRVLLDFARPIRRNVSAV
jgi:hypothetical protein